MMQPHLVSNLPTTICRPLLLDVPLTDRFACIVNMSILRNPLFSLLTTLSAIGGSTYLLRSHHIYSLEEHEERLDEIEGTLRGNIGLIEEALDRLEGKATEADRGKKMFVMFHHSFKSRN